MIAVGLLMTTIGLLCLLSPHALLPGLFLTGWGGGAVWFQYLATFRRDLRGALLISGQCSVVLLALLAALGFWLAVIH